MDLEAVRAAGRMVFTVNGLWCTSCAMALQRVLVKVPGVTSATVNFTTGSALVTWRPDEVDFSALQSRAQKLGYPLAPLGSGAGDSLTRQAQRIRTQLVIAVVFGMWSMLGSWVLYLNAGQLGESASTIAWLALLAGAPVVLYSGTDFYRAAWRTLRSGVAGIDALVTVGVWGSIAVSLCHLRMGSAEIYIDAATMLICFLLAGRLFEAHARQESHAALDALRQLAPEVATRAATDTSAECEVMLDQVQPGDLVLIRANERVPVDGTITAGSSALDCALLTGESLPVPVHPGDAILAGSINLNSHLTVRVDAAAGTRRIDLLGLRMLELFGARSSLSQIAERFVRFLLPAVFLVAVTASLRYLWIGLPVDRAALEALAILVAACPCAVGLAMPLAYILASQRAADIGVLFRDPVSMEGLARARIIAFDKTGTLTSGALSVADVECTGEYSAREIVALAAEAEKTVNHPIANALRRHAVLEPPPCGPFRNHAAYSQGVAMTDNAGRHIRVGARDWLAASGVLNLPTDVPGSVHVSIDERCIGMIRMTDTLRADSRAALHALKQQGCSLWLITGDTAAATQSLVDEIGPVFEQIHSGTSPEAKAELVARESRPMAFVGDGANDGLVLAKAVCGIAIPGASTVAAAAAGVVITQDGLSQLVATRWIAKRAMRVAKQNLFFSIFYNIVVVIGFFGAGVTPFAAAIAMLLSSTSVFLNTSRIAMSPRPTQILNGSKAQYG